MTCINDTCKWSYYKLLYNGLLQETTNRLCYTVEKEKRDKWWRERVMRHYDWWKKKQRRENQWGRVNRTCILIYNTSHLSFSLINSFSLSLWTFPHLSLLESLPTVFHFFGLQFSIVLNFTHYITKINHDRQRNPPQDEGTCNNFVSLLGS